MILHLISVLLSSPAVAPSLFSSLWAEASSSVSSTPVSWALAHRCFFISITWFCYYMYRWHLFILHPSVYLGLGCGGTSLIRETHTYLFRATSSSTSRGTPRHSKTIWETSFLRSLPWGLLLVGDRWKTLPRRHTNQMLEPPLLNRSLNHAWEQMCGGE